MFKIFNPDDSVPAITLSRFNFSERTIDLLINNLLIMKGVEKDSSTLNMIEMLIK